MDGRGIGFKVGLAGFLNTKCYILLKIYILLSQQSGKRLSTNEHK